MLALFFAQAAGAQEAQKDYINYQGIARNVDGQLMAEEAITLGIALKFGAANAASQYEEHHSVTTDANGVFSLKIGNGNTVAGDYKNLPWGSGATYMTVTINGNAIGTTEMMAVPYAIRSGDGDDQSADEVPYNNAVSGLTASTAQAAIDELATSGTVDGDNNPVNEIQTISFDASTNQLSLTDGGVVTIPSGGTDADADPTNEFQLLNFDVGTNELSLSDGNSVTIPSGGTDADPTNEIQDISLSGTDLTISEGSTIDLAPIVPPGGTDDQNLILTGDVLTIENGSGSVDLSSYAGDDADADPTNEIDVTSENGILLGDGATVSGLIGTAEGQVPKWDVALDNWVLGTDQIGGGGSSLWSEDANGINYSLGNIGIGASSSTFPLNISTDSDRSINISSSNTDNYIAFNNAGGFKGYAGIFNGDEDMDFGTGFLNTTGKVHLVTSTFPRLTVAADGNVGIGTQTPDVNLEVAGAGTVRSRMTSTDAGTVALQWLREGAANTDWMITAGSGGMSISHSSSDFSGAVVHTRLTEDGILDVGGGIRSANLEGTGQRNVVADADGNLMVESSTAGSSRKSNYFQSGSLTDEILARTIYTPIGPEMIFTKEYAESFIEVTVNSSAYMRVPSSRRIAPGDGSIYATRFQVRLDGRVADFGSDALLDISNNADNLSIFNVFEDLPIGNHNIAIFVKFLWVDGSRVEVKLDKDNLGGKIIVKETF